MINPPEQNIIVYFEMKTCGKFPKISFQMACIR